MARSRSKTTEPEQQVEQVAQVESEPTRAKSEGMGEHAYAGPRADDAAAKPAAKTGGTSEHLGDSPYSGSPS